MRVRRGCITHPPPLLLPGLVAECVLRAQPMKRGLNNVSATVSLLEDSASPAAAVAATATANAAAAANAVLPVAVVCTLKVAHQQ